MPDLATHDLMVRLSRWGGQGVRIPRIAPGPSHRKTSRTRKSRPTLKTTPRTEVAAACRQNEMLVTPGVTPAPSF